MLKRIYNFLTNKYMKRNVTEINSGISVMTIKKILEDHLKKNPKSLLRYGYKVFSQYDEDGIIDEILNRVKISNKKFVELGLEDGLECNTANLLFQGWDGLWIESQKNYVNSIKKNYKKYLLNNLKVVEAKVSPKNINELLNKKFNIKKNWIAIN